MLDRLKSYLLDAGEIGTPIGRALVAERYCALKKQVPFIYVLAVANLWGLEMATLGQVDVGLNFPTVFSVIALLRGAQWRRTDSNPSPLLMLKRLRQTCWLSAVLCLSISLWCLHLLIGADGPTHMSVMLFGGFTAIGTAYGLNAVPTAARLPIFVLGLPLAATAIASNNPQLIGAALSLACVGVLILELLRVQGAHFTDLIHSRAMLWHEQLRVEKARKQAVLAAKTDPLTGLPNRRAFLAALEEQTENENCDFAVAIVDLDNFKHVNDTLGHLTGDDLLVTVAARLLAVSSSDLVVARLGGDEFGLIFRGVARSSEARAAGARILSEIERLAVIKGREIPVAASMGISLSKTSSGFSEIALAEADLALYEAKCAKGLHLAVFEPSMEAPHQRRAHIERSLRLPGAHERLRVVFQPIVDLTSGMIIANEALARWNDPELGNVSPAEFVPIAERLNLIGNIGDYLMREAMREAASWPADVRLALNLSTIQLSSSRSADSILRTLKQVDLDAARLQVEVTETALLGDFDRARRNLGKLRDAGVTIVLDDFGAGFSSIGYLRELTFDQIKLDGSLITAAQDNADGERLLAATIRLCQALGVTTVAEHIENECQLRLVTGLGCSAGQGFWLHSPLSGTEIRDLMASAHAVECARGRTENSAAA